MDNDLLLSHKLSCLQEALENFSDSHESLLYWLQECKDSFKIHEPIHADISSLITSYSQKLSSLL